MNHREWGWGLPGRCIFLVVLIAALPFSKVLAEGDDGEASARNENEPFLAAPTIIQQPQSWMMVAGDSTAQATATGDVMAPWEGGPAYYGQWSHGPSRDPNVFPVAVWLQQPVNANAYRAIGINQFVGLWEGPTEAQLSTLTANSMPVICEQNPTGLSSANNGVIKGWLHQDEPDNAQPLGSGYGPPILPSVVITKYNTMRAADSTRPVYLNLGQGVAWDGWYGRGTRTNHPEDYPEYAKGADILSYDIYPMNSADSEVEQKIWLVAYGVDRLRQWSSYQKPVWVWIECTRISSSGGPGPSPAEVKAEVWMALVHGGRGIGYFAHKITPFDETGLLHNAEMSSAVTSINAQIASLATVLNTQSVANGVAVTSSNGAIPIDTMLKRVGGYTYIFAVAMRTGATNATFTLRDFAGNSTVDVIGETRQISANDGVFHDSFSDYAVHIYRTATGDCVAPTITTQPQSITVTTSQTATLAVAATGDAPLSYQWYQGSTGNTTLPVGTDGNTFTTPPIVTPTDYWVRISNGCHPLVDSATATVSVAAGCIAPMIATHPQSQAITSGQTVTLKVVANGTTPLHCRWYQGASGNTTSPLGLDSFRCVTPVLTSNACFWARVSNDCDSVNSNAAIITVNAVSSIGITNIISKTSRPGSTATIIGTGFGTDKKQIIVYFGTRKAKMISRAKTTSLKVTIPKRLKKGIVGVYVIVNNQASNIYPFHVK